MSAEEGGKKGLIDATGLWVKDGKNGKFFSGSMGNVQVFVFKNKHKTKDSHPDYILCFGQKEFDRGGARPQPQDEDISF